MPVLLLDPRIITPPGTPGASISAPMEYWTQIIAWAGDTRAQLGAECQQLLYSKFAEYGYPEQCLVPNVPAVRTAYQAAISKIMSRVVRPTSQGEERDFAPRYVGGEEEELALQLDISGTVGCEVIGIATTESSWAASTVYLQISPQPPRRLEICTEPNAPVALEVQGDLRDLLSSKRLFIVGGKTDLTVVNGLRELGFSRDAINWLESEKAKPPRNLDERWGALDSLRDVTVCITGRVGHSTSGKARVIASKREVPHLLVETARDVITVVRDHFLELLYV